MANETQQEHPYMVSGDSAYILGQNAAATALPGFIYYDSTTDTYYTARADGTLRSVILGDPPPVDQAVNGYTDFRFTSPTTVNATTGIVVTTDPATGLNWTSPGGWSQSIMILDPPGTWTRASALTHSWVLAYRGSWTGMIGFGDAAFDPNTGTQHFFNSGGAKAFISGANLTTWYGKNNSGANTSGSQVPSLSLISGKNYKFEYVVNAGPGVTVTIYEVGFNDWDTPISTLVGPVTVPNVGGNAPNLAPTITAFSPSGGVTLLGQRVA